MPGGGLASRPAPASGGPLRGRSALVPGGRIGFPGPVCRRAHPGGADRPRPLARDAGSRGSSQASEPAPKQTGRREAGSPSVGRARGSRRASSTAAAHGGGPIFACGTAGGVQAARRGAGGEHTRAQLDRHPSARRRSGSELGDAHGGGSIARATGQPQQGSRGAQRGHAGAQRDARPVEQLAHRAVGYAEPPRDLVVAAPFELAEHDRVALAQGQPLNGGKRVEQDLTPLEHLLRAILPADHVLERLVAGGAVAEGIQGRVVRDPVEPRS